MSVFYKFCLDFKKELFLYLNVLHLKRFWNIQTETDFAIDKRGFLFEHLSAKIGFVLMHFLYNVTLRLKKAFKILLIWVIVLWLYKKHHDGQIKEVFVLIILKITSSELGLYMMVVFPDKEGSWFSYSKPCLGPNYTLQVGLNVKRFACQKVCRFLLKHWVSFTIPEITISGKVCVWDMKHWYSTLYPL